jgi:hypothetical protein
MTFIRLIFKLMYCRYVLTTSARHDYVRHAVERQMAHQPDQYRPPEGEMDTTTSYNKEYVGRCDLLKTKKKRKIATLINYLYKLITIFVAFDLI